MLHYSIWSIGWLILGCAFHYLGYEHLTAMVFTLNGLCFVVFALIFLLFLMVWEF